MSSKKNNFNCLYYRKELGSFQSICQRSYICRKKDIGIRKSGFVEKKNVSLLTSKNKNHFQTLKYLTWNQFFVALWIKCWIYKCSLILKFLKQILNGHFTISCLFLGHPVDGSIGEIDFYLDKRGLLGNVGLLD